MGREITDKQIAPALKLIATIFIHLQSPIHPNKDGKGKPQF